MCLVISVPLQRCSVFDAMVIELAQHGPAPNSWRNLVTHCNKYREFCELLTITPFPITEQNLCRYLAFLTFSLTSSDSVLNYVAGLKKLHAFARTPFPELTKYSDTVFKGIKRVLAHQVKQSEPITPQILKQIATLVDLSNHKEVVMFTALVVGFYMFLRSSNLTAKTQTSFDPQKNLTRQDIRLAHNVALIEVRWSKTIQFLERKLLFPIIRILDEDICPITWLVRMVAMVPATPTDPAFCVFNRQQKLVPLTYRQLSDQLKNWIERIQLPSDRFSLHGIRRGGATFAFESDVAAQSIMVLGDWVSDSFCRYIDQNLECRLRAISQMARRCHSI